MNKNAILLACLTGASSLGAPHAFAQQAEKTAVSIVFTDLDRLAAIDTVITGGHKALHTLLQEHSLNPQDVLFIHADRDSQEWSGHNTHHKMMVLETEASESGDPHKVVKVVKVDGDIHDVSELSEADRTRIMEEIGHTSENGENAERTVIEKRIVIKTTEGEDSNQDIRVEKTTENGHTVTRTYVNGEEVSPEEAEALMKEHKQMLEGMEMKRTGELVTEDKHRQGDKVITKRRVHHSEGSMKKAIVIVKRVDAAGTSTPGGRMEGSLHLFPNPATKEATLSFEGDIQGDYTIRITNLSGQTVWQKKDTARDQLREKIDLQGLSPGTYILSLSHAQGIQSQKLVVE